MADWDANRPELLRNLQEAGRQASAKVRIHPFPNGNGRTARLLVNCIAQRYGLPAFMRLRPRPGDEYAWVASQAMEGHWEAAIPFMTRLYDEAI